MGKESSKKRQRNSNIELLRIVSMFLIVLHHFSVHGVAVAGSFRTFRGSAITRMVAELLASMGKPAVMLFVFITGFYLINSKFKLNRIVALWWKVFTYSVLILVFTILMLPVNVSIKDIFISFLPITYGAYWFITDYVILIIFVPFINMFILNSKKNVLRYFILTLWLVSSLLATLLIKSSLENNEILLFLLFYCIGAYIRLYVVEDPKLQVYAKYFTLIGIVLLFGGIIGLNMLAVIMNKATFSLVAMRLTFLDSTVALFLAIGIFLYVISWKPRNSKWINLIASSSLAVYIISDNNLLRELIWQDSVQARTNALSMSPIVLVGYALCTTSVIYIICTVIDLIKINTLDKWIDPTRWITKKLGDLSTRLDNKYNFH